MSKYIKKINWPWIEIEDVWGDTVVININEISAVWDNANTIYKHGIRFKDGTWSDIYKIDSLVELKTLLMNYNSKYNTDIGSLYGFIDPELLKENQDLNEYLSMTEKKYEYETNQIK